MTKTGQKPIKRLSKYVLEHFYYFSLCCVLFSIIIQPISPPPESDVTYSIVI